MPSLTDRELEELKEILRQRWISNGRAAYLVEALLSSYEERGGALEAVNGDLHLLLMAVQAGDPPAEVEFRIRDMIRSLSPTPGGGE